MKKIFDLAVIGGGINGCGVAADAALRGLSVILIEKDDLASKTSSNSSKLIHGGLRYLEHYDFRLVKKALQERQKLRHLAAHLVHPLSFVIPYTQTMRPAWLLRTALFVYDNLTFSNQLPKSISIQRHHPNEYFTPLAASYQKGFLYYDCTADDARLTLANAQQANQHGAQICLHTELIKGFSEQNFWTLVLKNAQSTSHNIHAKVVINAAGPWVNIINQRLGIIADCPLSLVKGSHLIVEKLYEGEHAYLLQNTDNRVVFVIPYLNNTLIGTTDVLFSGNLDALTIDKEEIQYLLNLVNHYFSKSISEESILSTYTGVRTLLTEAGTLPQAMSRDYSYALNQGSSPSLTIYGGKITTYRQLAKEAVDCIMPLLHRQVKSKTDNLPLPGSDPEGISFKEYCMEAKIKYQWLPDALLTRYLKTYGTLTDKLLLNCHSTSDLGKDFGHGLFQREIDYLIEEEWVTTNDDLLWRRTKLGLEFTEAETRNLQEYLDIMVFQPNKVAAV